jgi:hypothetical protein
MAIAQDARAVLCMLRRSLPRRPYDTAHLGGPSKPSRFPRLCAGEPCDRCDVQQLPCQAERSFDALRIVCDARVLTVRFLQRNQLAPFSADQTVFSATGVRKEVARTVHALQESAAKVGKTADQYVNTLARSRAAAVAMPTAISCLRAERANDAIHHATPSVDAPVRCRCVILLHLTQTNVFV